MRTHLTLSGLWRYQPDPAEEGEALGFWRVSDDVRHWPEAELPATFERCSPLLASYEGAVWFRRTFHLPQEWRGRHLELHFAGANYHTRVWVNGEHLGDNEDGFLPFSFPLGEVLRFGEDNVLVVRVDNLRREGEVPGRERGWRAYGGLLREVELVALHPVHLETLAVVAEPDGWFELRAAVANHTGEPAAVEVRAEVAAPEGPALAQVSLPLRALPQAGNAVTLAREVPGVQPWSPERPVRYCLRVQVLRDGELLDEESRWIGFRRVEAKGTQVLLNDQPLRLHGVNRHEDSPHTDMATDLKMTRRDLEHIKAMGLNFVRLCHYPHHPAELDLCDELGLLVMDEIPLYWWSGLEEGEEKCARKLEAAKRQLSRMIARDRNHPSVIFWSVSNETQEARPEVAAGNAELVRLAKSLDATRLATHVSDKWPQVRHFESDDVICLNAYPSWSGRLWQHNPHYDVAASQLWWREQLTRLHAHYADKPLLITEFGYPCFAGTLGHACGEEVQAEAIRAEFGAFDLPYVCGAVVWCYADHPWPEENFIAYMTTSPFGLVTRTREPKRACAVVQEIMGHPSGE